MVENDLHCHAGAEFHVVACTGFYAGCSFEKVLRW